MTLSKNGLDLIKQFEGCVLEVYLDCAGVKTVGYGHTGRDVNKLPLKYKITKKKAEAFLKKDTEKSQKEVNKYDAKYHWTQNEFDALVSFAFNIGNISQLTANGSRSKKEISEKMLLYVNAGGKRLQGLVNRRKKEQELFNKKSKTTKKKG